MSTHVGGATAVRRDRNLEEASVLGMYLQQQLDRKGWTKERLATELGKSSSSHVNKLLAGSIGMPSMETISDLSRVLGVPERELLLHAAKSAGLPVELDRPPAPTNEQLVYELARRLRDCAAIIEPLTMARDNASFVQTTQLRIDLDALTESAREAGEPEAWRATVLEHLGDYLDALIQHSGPTRDS